MRPRTVVLKAPCDSEKISVRKEVARAACDVFLNQMREHVGHDVRHVIPIDGEPILIVDDEDAISYLKQFKLLIVESVTKVPKEK